MITTTPHRIRFDVNCISAVAAASNTTDTTIARREPMCRASAVTNGTIGCSNRSVSASASTSIYGTSRPLTS